jgi:hypothetical protein
MRLQGRPANVGHFHDKVSVESFLCFIFERTLGMLQIHSKFVDWYPWEDYLPHQHWLQLEDDFNDNRTVINPGWAVFVVAHKLMIGHFLTFHEEALGV